MPVYIGYEKLMEGGSYTGRAGRCRQAQGIGGACSARCDLRHEHYGEVGVSFACRLHCRELLDAEGVRDMDNWLADKNLRRRTLTELSRQTPNASTAPCI